MIAEVSMIGDDAIIEMANHGQGLAQMAWKLPEGPEGVGATMYQTLSGLFAMIRVCRETQERNRLAELNRG